MHQQIVNILVALAGWYMPICRSVGILHENDLCNDTFKKDSGNVLVESNIISMTAFFDQPSAVKMTAITSKVKCIL